MIKALARFARGVVGVWSELRKLRTLLEWVLCNGLTGTFGAQSFTIHALGLPPSEKEQRAAEGEKVEHVGMVDEETLAADRLVDVYRRRAAGRGVEIDPEDPAGEYDLFS